MLYIPRNVSVIYEGIDINSNNCLYTRVLIRGSCGTRKWIKKSFLPEAPVIDQQYEISVDSFKEYE